jgi:hypothetical protein
MMKDVVTSEGDYAVLESNIDWFEDTLLPEVVNRV